jgi:glycosyltransferase involved in cell wall biosynthesis
LREKLKILLDPQIFVNQKIGGVSRQFVETWQYLNTYPDVEICSPLAFSENYHLQESSVRLRTPLRILQHRKFKGMDKIRELLNHVTLYRTKKLLSSNKFDVFLPTYYDPYFLGSLQGTPLILSVFDMIHEQFPQYFPKDFTTVPNKKVLLHKATRIIVHSNQTKNDVLKFYPDLDTSKFDLVPLASSVVWRDELTKAEPIIPYAYLLFVGTRDKYKNFTFFLRAVKSILLKRRLHLVCAGGGAFSDGELSFISELGLTGLIIQKTVSDKELPLLYRHALAFIFPSEYEGFGMPILEAMACSCPVILANNGVFKEIGTDAALYFDLNNAEMLENCIESMLTDDILRNRLIKDGLKREKEFSWKLTAKGYYDSILKIVHAGKKKPVSI